jgi:hypothetical protein
MTNFQIFASRCVLIFVKVRRNWLKLGIYANWYGLFTSVWLDFQLKSLFGQLKNQPPNLGH